MADPMDTIKELLGDNAEDTIKSVVSSLSQNGSNGGGAGGDNLQYLMQMRELADRFASNNNDSRSNLLSALKPYLRENRQHSVDTAIKLLNISKLVRLFR